MQLFKEGWTWGKDRQDLGMACTYGKDKTDLVIVAYERDTGQLVFRFMTK